MEILKNLPSYNKENFSRFIQGASKVLELLKAKEREREREREKERKKE